MKNVILAFLVLSFVSVADARDKTIAVKIEVMSDASSFQSQYQGAGIVGASRGRKTALSAVTLRTTINGDHALLRCYENHQGCNILGPGMYDGEIKLSSHSSNSGKGTDPDVWINYVQPLDHKVFREHWRVSGTW